MTKRYENEIILKFHEIVRLFNTIFFPWQYHDMVKPFVEEICSHLKPLDLREDDGFLQNQDVTMGTNLFELYLAVKQFAEWVRSQFIKVRVVQKGHMRGHVESPGSKPLCTASSYILI